MLTPLPGLPRPPQPPAICLLPLLLRRNAAFKGLSDGPSPASSVLRERPALGRPAAMPRLSSPLASMILLLPGSSCLLLMTHYHLSGSPECHPVRPLPGWSPPTPSSATILPTSLPGPVPSSDLSCTPDAYFQLLADSSPPECVAHPRIQIQLTEH